MKVQSEHPVIMCAVCSKPVDSAIFSYDEMTRMTSIVVHCHGRADRMQLSEEDKMRLGRKALKSIAQSVGVAFSEPKAFKAIAAPIAPIEA